VRVVLLSDTHSPRFWKGVPDAVAAHLGSADLVLHAGDVCTADVLDDLARFAPVHVVMGNNDLPEVAGWGAPETLELELEGVRVAMVHDSGAKVGRVARLRRRFPAADLVVFGHSHIPMDVTEGGLRIVNPGSPSDKRRQPHRTLALLDVADGEVRGVEIVDLA
jgi:putative phosphoesterase